MSAYVCRLQKLHCFESCSVQIGDKGFYALTESDIVQPVPTRAKKSPLHYVMKQLHNGGAINEKNKLNELRSHSNTDKPPPTNCHNIAPVDSIDNSGSGGDAVEDMQAAGGDDVKNCAVAVAKYLQEELACVSCDSEGGDDNDTDSDSSTSAKSNSSLPTTTGGKGRKRSGKKKAAVTTAAPPMGQGKSHKRKRQKQQQAKKMCGALSRASRQELRPGDQVAVEVLYTFSRVTVMWQVGTITALVTTVKNMTRIRLLPYIQWRTYRTDQPDGAVRQLGLRAVNHQHPISWLCCIHSLFPAFVNPRCRYTS